MNKQNIVTLCFFIIMLAGCKVNDKNNNTTDSSVQKEENLNVVNELSPDACLILVELIEQNEGEAKVKVLDVLKCRTVTNEPKTNSEYTILTNDTELPTGNSKLEVKVYAETNNNTLNLIRTH